MYDVMNWSNLKSNLILLRNENALLSTPQLLSSSNFVLFLSLHPYKLPYQKQATKNGEGYGYLYVTLDEAREVFKPPVSHLSKDSSREQWRLFFFVSEVVFTLT